MNDSILDNDISTNGVQITSKSKEFLKETARWTGFMAALGFIGVGLIVAGSLIMVISGAFVDEGFVGGSQVGIILAYLIFAFIYFIPVLYLYNFSKEIKTAVKSDNSSDYEKGFEFLKKHFKYVGVFTIVIISIYILIAIFAIVINGRI